MDTNESYLIWSNEHRAWWGPAHCGYSKGLQGAGKYDRDTAIQCCKSALPSATHVGMMSEIPVRAADVLEVLTDELIPSNVMVSKD
jgi:hypothetical protein